MIPHFKDIERCFIPYNMIKVMVEIFSEIDGEIQYVGTKYVVYIKEKYTFDHSIDQYFNDEVRYIYIEDGYLNVCLNHYE